MAEKSEELKTVDEKLTQAKELFARGSRNYLVKAYNDAADDLSQVCNIYEEVYGQLSDELGMPYLLYAKTLIALAEDENKVLSVPEEQNDDDDDEEDDEVDEEAEDDKGAKSEGAELKIEAELTSNETDGDSKLQEGNDKSQDTGASSNGNAKTENVNGNHEQGDTSKPTNSNNAAEPGTSNEVDGDNEENEIEEDDGANLQVAWELLELAVKIFERQGEPALGKLADAYNELAGVSFENSHFDAAIVDYQKSLNIHMKLPDDNRRIVAEIHYKIGLAHLMQNSFDDCIRELKKAAELMDEEIEEEKQKENPSEKQKDTIKDLEEAKQDILAKITEVEETKTQSIEEVRNELSKIMSTDPKTADGAGPSSCASGTNGSSAADKPKPTDISHLIKRKKPDSASNDVAVSPAKRPAV